MSLTDIENVDNAPENNEPTVTTEVVDGVKYETNENGDKTVVVDYKDPAVEAEENKEEEFKLPENFKSVEDLHKSYVELQRKLSKGETLDNEENNTNETDAKPDTDETSNGLLDGVEDNNETKTEEKPDTDTVLKSVEEKFMSSQDKELSEELVKELKEVGLTDSVINTMVKGWNVDKQEVVDSAKALEQEIYDSFEGGQKEYKEMFKWLKSQKDGDKTIKDYVEVVNTGNSTLVKREIETIKNRYKISSDVNGSVVTGGDVYKSESEYHEDLRSYKYQNDASFEKLVTEKAKRSGFFG